MLHGVFRTKEGKILAFLLVLVIIIAGAFVYQNHKADRQYEEQAVMAEKYLNDGNYEQAVDAYLKALSMNNSDEESLTIGLAEAYAGVKDFDKALEVLRTCYQKTSGNAVKEKIEDVTSRKTDYEYLQIISRADIYFTNKEYDKAITEYEKAKQIKSKEVTSYQRISEAYVEMGKYDEALEEVQEGLALTQSKELEKTLDTINHYQLKDQYDTMVSEADEYIYQENYEDGINKYLEAIQLLPEEEQAYNGLAQTYINLEEYQKAVSLLNVALNKVHSDELDVLMDKASGYVAEIEERRNFLGELYNAIGQMDIDNILELMNSDSYQKAITDLPVYYSLKGDGEEEIDNGTGMIIYSSNSIYSGQIKNGQKKGKGTYFMLTPQYGTGSYYYYQGEWNGNLPSGAGTTVELTALTNKDGETAIKKITTDGIFYNAAENGSMHKHFYENGEETGTVEYSSKSGVPLPMTDENGNVISVEAGKPYAIGILYKNGKSTGEYYYADPVTIWGVKPYMN